MAEATRAVPAGRLAELEANPPAAQTLTTFTTKHPGRRVHYLFTFGLDRYLDNMVRANKVLRRSAGYEARQAEYSGA